MRVTAIPSTDTGSAFRIDFDGFAVYHAGDHAATHEPPESAFIAGIEQLSKHTEPLDLAFLPVFGCGLPNVESLRSGNDFTIDCLSPRAVFPMHIGWTSYFYRREKARLDARNPEITTLAMSRPGDRCLYRDGKIHDLIGQGISIEPLALWSRPSR